MKYFLLFSFLFLIPIASHGAEMACTMQYDPVCGQPPMPTCPAGMACIEVMPAPKTYGNSCMMQADRATFIRSGECEASTPPAPKACTREYAPVCGTVAVQCITAPCDPIRTDYGNRCMAEAAGATDITGGTCEMSDSSIPMPWSDRDSHGCSPSAGSSWDASMQSCIRPWEYQDKVDWAYVNKITRYSSLSEFKYGNRLTRQEAAAFITRYLIEWLGRPEALCKLAYKDGNLIDLTLTSSVSRACGLGVMLGHNGYFHPRYSLTRGEALAVLVRAIDEKKHDETMKPWYQGYMDRASIFGIQFGSMNGFDEPITRGEFIEWLKTLSENSMKSDENLFWEWKLQEVSSLSSTQNIELAKLSITLTFDEKNLSTKICNNISWAYTISNSGTLVAPRLLSTRMACDGLLGTIEGLFRIDGATYSIQSARLMSGTTSPSRWMTIGMKDGPEFVYVR